MLFTRKKLALAGAVTDLPLASIKGRSPWADARRRFSKNKAAVVSTVLLVLITLACLIGPSLLPHAFDDTDWGAISMAPTWAGTHWFGTDELGRDILVRTLIGGRISLLVGLLGTLASVAIGIAWGAVAGFLGGKTDSVMMRIVDMMYAVPYLLIAILMMTLFGREFYLVIITIAVFSWLDTARVVRGQTLTLKSREFVEAAHAIGVPTHRIIFNHIVPNLLGIVAIYTTVTVPGVILTESVLSFLGLGVQEPMTSWGALIGDSVGKMDATPWMLLFPSLFLCLTLSCVNYIGDGLRDAFDPKDR
ncbi:MULTISPECIES: ABC transporter permease subunit [Silvimonas]|uniref:ABC transporter permease subunit n=1 Tax=Silvimonas TaxID=300264 RepID=UPI0024B38551|nr:MULTISPECIES: ABC transporter permease subunit [Silvimonas]MDR3429197.1 ABC transporter permease subunit [Silvimonas sp.]